ncbi:uncharacterized protein LOC111691586 [Anoplophora glabripennis]|uniref:uncharacterized protein LOC111691586 n=1 Tax=Anoplophora glabripennis TaxID=217634 RepID=UPI000C76CEC9|nr:uncharacterized protein LOC111691586 [Anoplophora glabripennis]
MIPGVCFLLCFGVIFVECHPTMYKINENKVLEPDLVPVSSTVIPLPVYQVGYGINLGPSIKDEKTKKPDGPITLITVHSKKKPYPVPKQKPSDVSTVKQISSEDEN